MNVVFFVPKTNSKCYSCDSLFSSEVVSVGGVVGSVGVVGSSVF